jgi:NADH-quinone oxidoreductase subunit N
MNYTAPIPTIEWLAIAPAGILFLTGVVALVLELLRPKANNDAIVGVTIVGLIGALVATYFGQTALPAANNASSFAGMVQHDSFGGAMTCIVIVATLLVVLFSEPYLREKQISFAEFYPLAVWSATGAVIMATTTNLLMVFIGLEILSLALYVLAGLSREEQKSEESALKYFLLGAFASGFLLYGIAFVYGASASLDLGLVGQAWDTGALHLRLFLLIGLGFILVGLGFKSSIFPFHQWVPDVYQGAPTNVTAFMAIVSKVGAFAALWRVLEAFGAMQTYWMPVLFWAAILTMCVGNLAALVQKDVKRILGYSAIAHAGYLLVAVLAHAKDPATISHDSLVFYLLRYALMTIGALAVLTLTAQDGKEGTRLIDLRGLFYRNPAAAVALGVCLFSLVGLPPTAGFVGKLLIFNDAVRVGLTPLAIVLAINSAVSAYYYLGIVWAAFQPIPESPNQTHKPGALPLSAGLAATCIICSIGVIAIVPLFAQVQHALLGR